MKKKVNVYYLGQHGATFPKLKKYFHRFRSNYFKLSSTDEIELLKQRTLNYRDLIIVDFDLKIDQNLEKLKEIRSELADKGGGLISLTNSVDHSSISVIAELGFDGILMKPFNYNSFKNVLNSVRKFSFDSNKYFLDIEKGKKALHIEKNYTKSYNIFSRAIKESSTPSLAYYFLGKTCELLKKDVNAINHFRRGLRLNKWHFKSLTSLLDSYLRHQDEDEAFSLLKHITKTYPESTERFCLTVKLAMQNFKFHEITSLKTNYEDISGKTDEIKKHYFSALYISAKYFLVKNKVQKANSITSTLFQLSNNDPYYQDMLHNTYQELDKLEHLPPPYEDDREPVSIPS